jgi:hypothetical protein
LYNGRCDSDGECPVKKGKGQMKRGSGSTGKEKTWKKRGERKRQGKESEKISRVEEERKNAKIEF